MKKLNIMSKAGTVFNKVKFKAIKHSPEILVATGIVAGVASTILACRATTKASKLVEKTKKDLEEIDRVANDEKYSDAYSEEDAKNDKMIVYTQTAVEFIKLYGPSVLLGAVSIASILGSHHILRKRNLALAAAYKTIDSAFKKYRGRVKERFGDEVEKEIRYGIKAKKFEETETDENGEEKKTTQIVNVVDNLNASPFAKFFDETTSTCWTKNWDSNLLFLRANQATANRMFDGKGFLFLNDVYDLLGMPRTQAGQTVGWIKAPGHDNFVDFGIMSTHRVMNVPSAKNSALKGFQEGYERVVLLDFNVDGTIIDKVPWEKV